MSRRMIAPLLFGAVGTAILIALGLWQLQRLDWKRGILAEIDARISAPAVALPASPSLAEDRFRPVAVSGRFLPGELHVLTSVTGLGPGFRVIQAFETAQGRRILVDRGFIPQAEKTADRPVGDGETRVVGNLHWPDERDGFTPKDDVTGNLWYARDVTAMAATLGTEPALIVAREPTGAGIAPLPIDTSGIRNDHLEYALTWFMLAGIWAGMTLLLLWRIRRRGI